MTGIPHARVWLVTVGITSLTVALYAAVVPPLDEAWSAPGQRLPAWVLALAFVLAERTTVWLPAGKKQGIGLTLSEIPLVIGLFYVDPLTLLAAQLVGTCSGFVARGRLNPHKDLFNLALAALGVGVAESAWHLVVGGAGVLGPRAWLATVLAVLLSELVIALMITVVIWADTGGRPDLSRLLVGWELLVGQAAACFGLVFVYVLDADRWAVWLPLVMSGVLYLAHRSYATLWRRSLDLQSVSDFTGRLGRFLEVDAVVSETLRTMTHDLKCEVAEIYVAESESADGMVWRLDRRQGCTVQVVPLMGSAIGLLDPPRDLPWAMSVNLRTARAALPRRAGVRDALSVPVLREGEPVGTALVADRDDTKRSFGKGDVPQLQALANHAATALHNARLTETMRTLLAQREHQASHDELTGLPNRRAFAGRLADHEVRGTTQTVAVIDLDHFHDVNDVLGPATGDAVLTLVAARLRQFFGTEHIARLGSDEFAVLLDCAPEESGGLLVRARDLIQHNLVLGDLDLSPSVSIGVAGLGAGEPAGVALAHADLALRRAKSDGSGIVHYDPALDEAAANRLRLLADLRQAVEQRSLGVAFQPQVRLSDGQVVGFEALARWHHPQRGVVPPDTFIPLAEQGGLMLPLTLFVLDEALARLAEWRGDASAAAAPLGVSVNVSPRTLVDPELLTQTERLLRRHGVPARALTVEITESDIMAEPERAVLALHGLSDLGVRLSVDDLGTGYSSLAYLSRFPLNELKIDKSFILNLIEDPATEAVVDAVIGLGHRLGRTVVAEGVEDVATLTRLRTLGCDVAQGYHLSRPLPATDVPGWLAGQDRRFSRTRTLTSIGVPVKPNSSRNRRSMNRR